MSDNTREVLNNLIGGIVVVLMVFSFSRCTVEAYKVDKNSNTKESRGE